MTAIPIQGQLNLWFQHLRKIDGNKDENTIYLYRNIKNENYLLMKKNDTSSSQDPNKPQGSTTNGFLEILKTMADAAVVL